MRMDVERLGPHPLTAATDGPSREWLRTYNGYPRGAAFTSLMALRGTFPLGYFDFVTRQVHKIADLPGLFVSWGPSISADGHTFLFSGIEHSESEIFLVEGFR
jgi:hypothetical protein